ncbi:doxX family protein [Cytobacillus firmus]|uniref:DoxX family protein n=1 Tax=Cytobacillus firmus TaxID=1399 RepID=UPI0018CF5C6F|nr:DoxX family protein [Cytobacillus firmus]MBG9447397.1 doxX family protein [Cytobacillus firmus]MBG9451235.1 doxX family protein [Cytobacillus firmus]WHY32211.1 DoxX family protein [Cytobacillus firmus]
MDVVTMIIQIILIFIFAISISMKAARTKSMVKHWGEYRYPLWFMQFIAFLEILSVGGLIIGFWLPKFILISGSLITILMMGALHAHFLRARHRPIMGLNALTMLILAIIITFFQFSK